MGRAEGESRTLKPGSPMRADAYSASARVGEAGFEPATTSTQSLCTTGLCDSPEMAEAEVLLARHAEEERARQRLGCPGRTSTPRRSTERAALENGDLAFEPLRDLVVRDEALLVGDVVEALEHLRIRTEALHTERDHDRF